MNGFSLDGQTPLISGAGQRWGLAIAKAMGQAGAEVLLHARDLAQAQSAVQGLAAFGQFRPLAFDLTDENAMKAALAEHPEITILVNNAGLRDRRPLADLEGGAVRALLEVNLIAALSLTRLVAPPMRARRYGRILNISSIAGQIARGDAAYTASKGGLDALTRALAAELGPDGINVNALAPGFFATETNAQMAQDPSIDAWLQQRTSLGRWGMPEEIAGAAVFLCSPGASYVTGQILAVDGGYLAHF